MYVNGRYPFNTYLQPRLWAAAALTIAGSATIPVPALAKSAVLEEVVVTARRRAENLQETPISVSALGGDYLDEMGINSIQDVEALTPSLQFSQTNYKAPAVFIRGIGQRSGNPVLDPGVGMYLNGVYIPRSDAQLLDAVDVANIQVLRGPQGTLFGKNNIGGAILVDSKKPNTEAFEFAGKFALGSHGVKGTRIDGNIPLIEDKLGLRWAANVKRSDGFIDNDTAGNALFDEDRMAVSGRTIWYISDTVELDVFALMSRIDERGSPYNCLFQSNDAILTQGFYRGDAGQNLEAACDISNAKAKDFAVTQNDHHAKYAIDNKMLAGTLSFELGGLDVESISSYSMQDNINISGDSDGTAIESVSVGPGAGINVFQGGGEKHPEQERFRFSQEFKFNGMAFDDRLNYTFGVFYSFEELNDVLDGTDVGDNGLVAVGPNAAGLPADLPPTANAQEVLPVQANTASLAEYENETRAIFAQGTWEFVEWLQLTLGIRYTEENRKSTHTQIIADFDEYAARLNAQIGSDPAITRTVTHYQDGIYSPVPREQYFAYTAPQVPLVRQAPLTGDTKFSEITPSLTVNFIATDDMLESIGLDSFIAYFTLSDGFKSGGLDVRNTQTESNIKQFEPELVTNTEVGVKFDAFESRLRFNAAVYQLDYENLQVALYEVGATDTEVIQFTGNAGKAVVDGFEFELTALLGNWTVSANAGYIDGDFVEYQLASNTTDGFRIIDRSNEAFPQVPQNTRGIVIQYDINTAAGRFVPLLQYNYADELFIGTDYLSPQFESSTVSQYEVFNARMLWEVDEQMSVTAFVNNIKNDQHFIGGISVTSVIGVANRVPGLPRHFGIDFQYRME